MRANNYNDVIDILINRVNSLPTGFDNETWRREFIINPILTNPHALGFLPSEIGAEISYPLSSLESNRILNQFGKKRNRIRPDYVILPAGTDIVAAVIEAKKRQPSIQSHLRHSTQVKIEQMVTKAPWGLLTDGERWTLFWHGDEHFHCDNLEELRKGLPVLKKLIGKAALGKRIIEPPRLAIFTFKCPKFGIPRSEKLLQSLCELFPDIGKNKCRILAPASVLYNSIAAAAGDRSRWWEPDPMGIYHWPSESERKFSLTSLQEVYGSLGFEVTNHAAFELGFERIAIFAKSGIRPTHVSYQLSLGVWGSKIGMREEIAHPLHCLEGDDFGKPTIYMRRKQ